MKKALLFVVALAAGLSSQAQITDTLFNYPFKMVGTQSHSQLSSEMPVRNFYQLDTVIALPNFTQFTPGPGYLSGMSQSHLIGAAEAYNPSLNPLASMQITGAISVWAGTVSPSSTVQVIFKVWNNMDTMTHVDVGGGDSVTGFPTGAALVSKMQYLKDIAMNAMPLPPAPAKPRYNMTSFTPTPITSPFFLGYEFGTGTADYTWGGPDTATLCNAFVNRTITTGHEDFYKNMGTYKLYYSRQAGEITPGVWKDYYWSVGSAGGDMFLCIVPIIQYDNAVGNVTKNNLTTYNAFPNPATNTINIKYAVQHSTDVTITILDMSGRTVNVINQSKVNAGEHVVPVSIRDLSAGNYVYMVRTSEGDGLATKFTVSK